MNLLHFSWGVGATICPLLAAGIGLGPSSLPLLYFTICIIGIVCTAPLLFFESPLVDTTNDIPGLIKTSNGYYGLLSDTANVNVGNPMTP